MRAAYLKHNSGGVAIDNLPPRLSRKLLKWLARRGDRRLVATLLELEAAYHDAIETVSCSLENLHNTVACHPQASQNVVGIERPADRCSVLSESGYTDFNPEGSGVEPVGRFFSRALEQLITEAQERSGLEPALIMSMLAQAVIEKRWQLGLPAKMRDVESEVVHAALKANDGDRSRTATQLGIGRRRLDYRLRSSAHSNGKSASGS